MLGFEVLIFVSWFIGGSLIISKDRDNGNTPTIKVEKVPAIPIDDNENWELIENQTEFIEVVAEEKQIWMADEDGWEILVN